MICRRACPSYRRHAFIEKIQQHTAKDEALTEVISYVEHGKWPKIHKDSQLYQLYARRDCLSVVNNCLMMANRVVVPPTLRAKVLKLLHEGHPGINRMKARARNYVYWPRIDADIQSVVQKCNDCQLSGKIPVKVLLASWKSGKPWSRVHADNAGPVHGSYFLVLVDSYSKWPEIVQLRQITSSKVIMALGKVYARFGNPEVLVSDNGTQFKSSPFQNFCKSRGIKQIFSAPYHPQSNGQAERFVDILKSALKKFSEKEAVTERLQKFLETYRNTPSTACPGGKSPVRGFPWTQATYPVGHDPTDQPR